MSKDLISFTGRHGPERRLSRHDRKEDYLMAFVCGTIDDDDDDNDGGGKIFDMISWTRFSIKSMEITQRRRQAPAPGPPGGGGGGGGRGQHHSEEPQDPSKFTLEARAYVCVSSRAVPLPPPKTFVAVEESGKKLSVVFFHSHLCKSREAHSNERAWRAKKRSSRSRAER